MKTYNEMDKEIIKLLDMEGMPLSIYAARVIETLQAEVTELRARLESAVGLPYMYEAEVVDSAGHFLKTIYVVVYNNNGTIQAIQYSYKKVAEARLKEIQGGER